MKLRLIDPERLIPDAHVAAEEAVRGIEVLIIDHLRKKNDGTQPNRYGLPKTKYYADAAKNVEASVDGATVRVEIDHPGISMHYEGGTVYPKKKALALPIDPAVAGIWPSEYSRDHKLFKTPGGALGDDGPARYSTSFSRRRPSRRTSPCCRLTRRSSAQSKKHLWRPYHESG